MERLKALLATLLGGWLLGLTRSEVAILVKCVRVFQLSQIAQRHVCLATLLLQLVELLSQPFVLLLQLRVAGCIWSLLDPSNRRFTCVGGPASLLIALFIAFAKKWAPKCAIRSHQMFLDGARSDGQNGWIGITAELFIGQDGMQSIELQYELVLFRRQLLVDA